MKTSLAKDPFVYLLALAPLALALGYVFHAPPVALFASGVAAIVPLAEWIRRSTEHLAARLGSAVGGLINVSFGNAAELILALFVLRTGAVDVVKAQVTGSIIGNALLGLGLAALIGGWGRAKQTFSREQSGRLSSLLMLSLVALMLPALFDLTERGVYADPNPGLLDERLSLGVSVVLITIYVINLVYSLVQKHDTFQLEDEAPSPGAPPAGAPSAGAPSPGAPSAGAPSPGAPSPGAPSAGAPSPGGEMGWPVWVSLLVLVGATALTALEAEQVSAALEQTSAALGLSTFFLGIIVLAVIGNAAEYLSAVYFARQDRMDLVMGITVGSTIQVALLLAPLLVIISYLMGAPMNLVFSNPLELIAIAAAAFIVDSIAHDGESTWFEGIMLVGVYLLLALAFLFASAA